MPPRFCMFTYVPSKTRLNDALSLLPVGAHVPQLPAAFAGTAWNSGHALARAWCAYLHHMGLAPHGGAWPEVNRGNMCPWLLNVERLWRLGLLQAVPEGSSAPQVTQTCDAAAQGVRLAQIAAAQGAEPLVKPGEKYGGLPTGAAAQRAAQTAPWYAVALYLAGAEPGPNRYTVWGTDCPAYWQGWPRWPYVRAVKAHGLYKAWAQHNVEYYTQAQSVQKYDRLPDRILRPAVPISVLQPWL